MVALYPAIIARLGQLHSNLRLEQLATPLHNGVDRGRSQLA
jgi:hypothetical protein